MSSFEVPSWFYAPPTERQKQIKIRNMANTEREVSQTAFVLLIFEGPLGFMAAMITRQPGVTCALIRAQELKLTPAGKVTARCFNEVDVGFPIEERFLDRLLSHDDLVAAGILEGRAFMPERPRLTGASSEQSALQTDDAS